VSVDREPGVWLERESFGKGWPMGGGLDGGQLLIKGAMMRKVRILLL
jgi:hypothetical protein